MRRETADLVGSGLLLAALLTALLATLAPSAGAGVASSGTAATPPVAVGEGFPRARALFYAKGCVACHALAGESGAIGHVGPDLTGLAARAGDRRPGLTAVAYVRESLRTPSAFLAPGYQAVMPDLGLSDEEIDALSAFLLESTQ